MPFSEGTIKRTESPRMRRLLRFVVREAKRTKQSPEKIFERMTKRRVALHLSSCATPETKE